MVYTLAHLTISPSASSLTPFALTLHHTSESELSNMAGPKTQAVLDKLVVPQHKGEEEVWQNSRWVSIHSLLHLPRLAIVLI
jgi:hypothetical protein